MLKIKDKLNVGDYVRTKEGNIGKIIDINKSNYNYLQVEHNLFLKNENILKSSSNIIDLIEVGDYVNGCWVNEIKDGKPYHEDYNDPYYSYYIENEDIKTVVTHEQFENISYKVGE